MVNERDPFLQAARSSNPSTESSMFHKVLGKRLNCLSADGHTTRSCGKLCLKLWGSFGAYLVTSATRCFFVCLYVSRQRGTMCVFSSHSFWTSSSLDVPAGVTQEKGHTGFLIHLLSAVHALIFLARRIQPFLSLVDRLVEFYVLTI